MESSLALTSIPPTSSDDPSSMTPLPERPKQGKFSKEEVDFLKTHLPAYEALCHQLEEQETGLGSVKGCKKSWILSEVYPKFVKQFLSDQNGGPQLQSLREVSYLLWHFILAKMVVENSAMVHKSLASSESWLKFKSTTYCHFQRCFPASACHQRY
jgi:hypothetical protein